MSGKDGDRPWSMYVRILGGSPTPDTFTYKSIRDAIRMAVSTLSVVMDMYRFGMSA